MEDLRFDKLAKDFDWQPWFSHFAFRRNGDHKSLAMTAQPAVAAGVEEKTNTAWNAAVDELDEVSAVKAHLSGDWEKKCRLVRDRLQ